MRARVPLRLWPAIDIRGGVVAQAAPGDRLADPFVALEHWRGQGAERIHLVDLDRATGRGHNDDLLKALVAGAGLPVEVSGGILSVADVDRALGWGAVAVTSSSALWIEPARVRAVVDHDSRVQVGLDLAGDRVVARGTSLDAGPVDALWSTLSGLGERRWVVASAVSDGRRTGPDLAGLRRAVSHLRGTVIASGGVGSTGDLVALSSLRGPTGPAVGEVILGAGLYSGSIELAHAQRLLTQVAGPAEPGPTDSAGTPWEGRSLTPGAFDQDEGHLDPGLAGAVPSATPRGSTPLSDRDLVAALGTSRVFVALLAQEATDAAELAIAQVTTPQGWSALPVFTTADAVARWRPEARPVPVQGRLAAQSAVQDGAAALVIDPGSPGARVVRPSMTSALARDMAWLPATQDEVVVAGLRRLKEHPDVTGVALRLGPQGELVLGLRGVTDDRRAGLLVAEALADPELRSRVDGVVVSALGLDPNA